MPSRPDDDEQGTMCRIFFFLFHIVDQSPLFVHVNNAVSAVLADLFFFIKQNDKVTTTHSKLRRMCFAVSSSTSTQITQQQQGPPSLPRGSTNRASASVILLKFAHLPRTSPRSPQNAISDTMELSGFLHSRTLRLVELPGPTLCYLLS